MIWTPVRSAFKHKNVIKISKKKKKEIPVLRFFKAFRSSLILKIEIPLLSKTRARSKPKPPKQI